MAKKTIKTENPLPDAKLVKEQKAVTKVKADKVTPETGTPIPKKTVKTKASGSENPVAETQAVPDIAKTFTAEKPVAAKKTASAKPKIAIADKPAETAPLPVKLKAVEPYSRLTDFDISLFKSGKHYKLYEKLGSHVVEYQGVIGTYFAVWAPNAQYVAVIGNFNGWKRGSHSLNARWDSSGIWEGFIANVGVCEKYKYYIK
jgi:1,4-alpha-glucan branching enzyme